MNPSIAVNVVKFQATYQFDQNKWLFDAEEN